MNTKRHLIERIRGAGFPRPRGYLQALARVAIGAALLVASAAAMAQADASQVDYREPSRAITELLTATPPPTPLTHASSGQVALLFTEPVIELERLARPYLGLAGFRFDPLSRTSGVAPLVTAVEVIEIGAGGKRKTVHWRPRGADKLDYVSFSPNGRYLSALKFGAEGALALVLFDLHERKERRLEVPVNAAWGEPCRWVAEEELLCRVLPAREQQLPRLHLAPVVIEHRGGPSPVRAYNNLLDNANEDALFEFYFTAELARVRIDGRIRRIPQTSGLFSRFSPSADGSLALINRLQKPYPRLVPARRFPNVLEVWDLSHGKRLYQSPPSGFGVEQPVPGAPDRPHRVAWKPGSANAVGFIRRRPRNEQAPKEGVDYRWLSIAAPFDKEPDLIVSSERPIDNFGWTTAGTPYFSTPTDEGTGVAVHVVFDDGPREVWSGAVPARYMDAGRAIRADGFDGPVLEIDEHIYIAGHGISQIGPRPFLDRSNLKTGESERLFTADSGVFEEVLAVLDPDGPVLLTSRETEDSPPNLYRVDGDSRTALRPVAKPYPALDKVQRRVVRYHRGDDVALSGTLYLPEGWDAGDAPLPTLIWIYPYEFADREHAERMDVRGFRYHKVKGPSPLAAVLEGYAVLVNPTVPIVGEGDVVNDTYVKQLVASAEAAADYLVARGVSDPARIAVGGRSYGAFSSANLLVHSERFATAISMSGAYNRTLTPFGFQHEKRTFWEAADMYTSISPFFHADQIDEPILLVHGGADPNPGTPPLQAERFFHALVGEGVQVRYVELPYEGHHYWARESVLTAAREMLDWLDRTLAP